MYFTQFYPLLEQGVPLPEDFLEVIDMIDVATPLTEEETKDCYRLETFKATVD